MQFSHRDTVKIFETYMSTCSWSWINSSHSDWTRQNMANVRQTLRLWDQPVFVTDIRMRQAVMEGDFTAVRHHSFVLLRQTVPPLMCCSETKRPRRRMFKRWRQWLYATGMKMKSHLYNKWSMALKWSVHIYLFSWIFSAPRLRLFLFLLFHVFVSGIRFHISHIHVKHSW